MDEVVGRTLADKKIVTLLLVLIILLALSLRLVGLGSQNLGPDEIKMAETARPDRAIREVMYIPLVDTPTPKPPLTYLIVHSFLHIADTDFSLRLPSVVFGTAGVAAAYAVAALLAGRRVGLLSAFLLSISVVHIRYSQVARFYPLLLLLSLLSFYSLHRAIFGGERKWWFALTVTNVLNLYNHYSAFYVLGAECAIVGALWIWETVLARRAQGSSSSLSSADGNRLTVARSTARILLPFAASATVSLFGYLPMLSYLLADVGVSGQRILDPLLSVVKGVVTEWVPEPGWSLWLAVALFLAGSLSLLKRRRRQLLMIALWLAIPLLVLYSVPLIHKFYPRYFAFMLPMFLAVSSIGIIAVHSVVAGVSAKLFDRPGLSWIGTAGLLVLVIVPTGLALGKYYAREQSDWRAASGFVCAFVSSGDSVLVRRASHEPILQRYCDTLRGQSFVIVGRPDAALLEDLLLGGGVWIIGKETVQGPMSELERELGASADGPMLRVVFQGSVDTGLPGMGQRLLDDVWVLHAGEDVSDEGMIEVYERALSILPPDAEMLVLSGRGGE